MATVLIDDVESVNFTTEPHHSAPGGILTIRVVSRSTLTGQAEVTLVNLQVWRYSAWDLLRDIERAQAAAQAPQPDDADEVK